MDLLDLKEVVKKQTIAFEDFRDVTVNMSNELDMLKTEKTRLIDDNAATAAATIKAQEERGEAFQAFV